MNGTGLQEFLRSMPMQIHNTLRKIGKRTIKIVRVCRKPINSKIKEAINLLSLGELERTRERYSYDDIFHLFMIITLDNGEMWTLQKNSIVELTPYSEKYDDCPKRYPTKEFTLNELFLILETKYSNIYLYDAWSNNCQDFVNKSLHILGITDLDDFVLQYFAKPFQKKYMRKITRFLNDASAIYDRVLR